MKYWVIVMFPYQLLDTMKLSAACLAASKTECIVCPTNTKINVGSFHISIGTNWN